MQGSFEPEDEQRKAFRIPLVAAAALGSLLLIFFLLFSSAPSRQSRPAILPFGPAEQAYAPAIHLGDFSLSRAENFVQQEVIILAGEVSNTGPRSLAQVEVTVEFRDSLNQVVSQETRLLFGSLSTPLAPGQRRTFELSFEHLPKDWNKRTPLLRVSGLRFS